MSVASETAARLESLLVHLELLAKPRDAVAYSLSEASRLTGLAPTKLKYRVTQGVLVARYEGKDLLFERAELERYIQSLPQERA